MRSDTVRPGLAVLIAALLPLAAAGPAVACSCVYPQRSDAAQVAHARKVFVGTVVSAKLTMTPFPGGDFNAREAVTFRVIDPIKGVRTGELVSFDRIVRGGSCYMSVTDHPAPGDIVNRFEGAVWPGSKPARVDWSTWLVVDDLNLCGISRPLGVREARGTRNLDVRRLKRLARSRR